MKCGFFEKNITPPLGSIIPGGFAARYNEKVQEPLFVRAFVAENDETTLAIAVVDACGITKDITDAIRQRVATLTPILPENVMVMATHCHGGGPTLNWGEEVVTDPAYLDFLEKSAADSIAIAYENAAESRLTFGKEELFGVSFIRIYRMKDGSFKTNPSAAVGDEPVEPYTTIDPEVLVLGVWQNGAPVGAIVNFANHPAIVSISVTSSDYIYHLSQALKKEFGDDFITLFINGACGNINHINFFDSETRLPGRQKVVGEAIAEKAVSALRRGAPMKTEALGCSLGSTTAHFRKPSAEALLEAQAVMESYGDDLINQVPKAKGYQKVFFAMNALRAMADKRTQRELELQLMQIGDCYVAGTPTQIFTEFGKAIKEGIGAPTMVSAFANDYCGYVPIARMIGEKKVYEQKLCPTSALAPDTGDRVCEGIIALKANL
ncbi:MAG: neutral/alkaline non-lysosomal ceramidase N-terminal domain-containing protein [Clostridia bacterium]|nr:neutral/alkaline non-lysosomal ceramidase N-terminal domain-containing protein [Clostridia bacterium]